MTTSTSTTTFANKPTSSSEMSDSGNEKSTEIVGGKNDSYMSVVVKCGNNDDNGNGGNSSQGCYSAELCGGLGGDTDRTDRVGRRECNNNNLAGNEKVNQKAVGFARGLAPLKILGCTQCTGELLYLMQWKDCDETDIVTAEDANELCPQVVIEYMQSIFFWHKYEADLK